MGRDSALPQPDGLVSQEDARIRREEWRAAGLRVVFTNGCFDLIHPGHVLYLAEARALGDVLIVGLNSDASVRALKGEVRPYLDERARAIVLLGLRSVDLVTVFDAPTPLELIRMIRPDTLAKGGDYQPEEVVGREVVLAGGGDLRILPFHPGYSTSALTQRIRQG